MPFLEVNLDPFLAIEGIVNVPQDTTGAVRDEPYPKQYRNNCEIPMKSFLVICSLFLFVIVVAAQNSLQDGITLLEKKEYDKAKNTFESLLTNDDKNAEAHRQLGFLLCRKTIAVSILDYWFWECVKRIH